MSNSCRAEFTKWLNEVFNDFYTVWSPNDCEEHLVLHKPEADNEGWFLLLPQLYPKLNFDFDNIGFGFTQKKFIFYVEDVTIEVEGIDDRIHNTEYVKEKN